MGDKLTEIHRDDLPLLRDLYRPDGSRSYIACVTIDTYIRWFQQDSDLKHVKFYCLNGDFSHGTFVVTDCNYAYTDTFHESTDELLRLLLLLDWSKGYFVNNISSRVASVVRQVVEQKKLQIYKESIFLNYSLPKEKALEFDIQLPDGIELRPLTQRNDIEKAHSVWPIRGHNPIQCLKRAAKYSPNVGAFTKDGTLVSWAFRFPTGFIMALQTDEKFYGRGYAKLITKVISKSIAELGHNPCGGIFETNTASRALFEKLGFKVIGHLELICTTLDWPELSEWNEM